MRLFKVSLFIVKTQPTSAIDKDDITKNYTSKEQLVKKFASV